MSKRSSERFPSAPPPLEPGNKSSKTDTKNIGGTETVEHHDKEGRDYSSFGSDDGCRFKKGK